MMRSNGRRLFAVVGILVLVGSALPVWAQRTVSSEKPITLRLPLYKPVSLQLPEPILKVSSIHLPDLFTAEFMGVYFYVTAKVPEVDHRVFLISQSGQQYQVDFRVETPPDTIVKVIRASPESKNKASPFGRASWLRALRLHQPIPGQTQVTLPAPVPSDARISILTSAAVSRGNQIGMVVHLQNTTERPLLLDGRLHEMPAPLTEDRVFLEQWAWPPRLTIDTLTLDEPMLAPGEWMVQPGQTTRLYILFEKR